MLRNASKFPTHNEKCAMNNNYKNWAHMSNALLEKGGSFDCFERGFVSGVTPTLNQIKDFTLNCLRTNKPINIKF